MKLPRGGGRESNIKSRWKRDEKKPTRAKSDDESISSFRLRLAPRDRSAGAAPPPSTLMELSILNQSNLSDWPLIDQIGLGTD